jgi:hypothetical protein
MMGVGVIGIMSISLYAGLSFGFAQIQLSREEERATQILAERMEVVRLLSWDQLVKLPGYVPKSFKASYSIDNPTNTTAKSLMYFGTVSVSTNAPVSESYGPNMRMVEINVTWQSGPRSQQRTMSTFVYRNGLQNYIY